MERTFGVLVLAAVVASLAIGVPAAFAQEDEEREGFGLTEREQEREREDDDDERGSLLGGGITDMVLAGTAAAIVGVGGYAGYKVYQIKKKARPKSA